MANVNNDIRAALESKLANTTGLPSIAYENVSFSPTTGTSFLKANFIPTFRRPAVLGLSPQKRYQGVFVVTTHAPEGTGPKAANDYVDIVEAAFEATTHIYWDIVDERLLTEQEAFVVTESGSRLLATNAIDVSIEYAERQVGFVDTPWYYVPLNIGWYCYK